MLDTVTIALLAAGVPVSALRLWWIWWRSICGDCGFEHRACACGPDPHTMRPRR